MAIVSEVAQWSGSSPPGPSQSCNTAAVRKWTCTALKTWFKACGLNYSGMKKDELGAKSVRKISFTVKEQAERDLNPPLQLLLLQIHIIDIDSTTFNYRVGGAIEFGLDTPVEESDEENK